LNRMSLDNFAEDITPGIQQQASPAMNGTLLALQNTKGEVKGIWCSNEAEITAFSTQLQSLIASAKAAPPKKAEGKKQGKKSESQQSTGQSRTAAAQTRTPAAQTRTPAAQPRAAPRPKGGAKSTSDAGMPAALAAMFANASLNSNGNAGPSPPVEANAWEAPVQQQFPGWDDFQAPPALPQPNPNPVMAPPQQQQNESVSDFFAQFQKANTQLAPPSNSQPNNKMPPIQQLPQVPLPPMYPAPVAVPVPNPAKPAPGTLSMAVPLYTPQAAGHFAAGIACATGGVQVNRVQLQHTLYSLTMNESFLEEVYAHLKSSGYTVENS